MNDILTPLGALFYVEDVVKKPFPALEYVILQSGRAASEYAIRIIRKRWPKAESIIRHNHDWDSWPVSGWDAYCSNFFRDFTDTDKLQWLREDGITDDWLEKLNRWGMSKRVQKYIVRTRPDLIGRIEHLESSLKKKYWHEAELAGVDL